MNTSIPFNNPIIFVLAMGLLASKKEKKLFNLCFCPFIMNILAVLPSSKPAINSLRRFKFTQREKAPSTKAPALTKSINMEILVFGTAKHLFIRRSKITIFIK